MSDLSRVDILNKFKTNLIKFIDALIEQFPSEGDLIVLRVFLSQAPITTVMEVFAERTLPYKDMILNRDEDFILNKSNVFDGLGNDKVNYFKNLWTSADVTDEDKDQIWKWFKLFVGLAEKYSS